MAAFSCIPPIASLRRESFASYMRFFRWPLLSSRLAARCGSVIANCGSHFWHVLTLFVPMCTLPAPAHQATTGPHGTRALDVIPTRIHQRCPIVLGSRADVEDLEQLYAKHADAASAVSASQ